MSSQKLGYSMVFLLILMTSAFPFGGRGGHTPGGIQIKKTSTQNNKGQATLDNSSQLENLKTFVTEREACKKEIDSQYKELRNLENELRSSCVQSRPQSQSLEYCSSPFFLQKNDNFVSSSELRRLMWSSERRKARAEESRTVIDLYISLLRSGERSSDLSLYYGRALRVRGECVEKSAIISEASQTINYLTSVKEEIAGLSNGGNLGEWIAEREACIEKNNKLKAEFKEVYDNFQLACQQSISGVCQNYTNHYMSYSNVDSKTLPENYSVHYGRAYREDKIYLTDLLKDKAIDNELFNQGIAVAGACDERIARDISFASRHWQSNIGIANLPSNTSPGGGGGSFASQSTTPTSVVPTSSNSKTNATTDSFNTRRTNSRVPASVGGGGIGSYHGTNFHAQ